MTLILACLALAVATTLGSGTAARLRVRAGQGTNRRPDALIGSDIRTW